MSNRILRLYLLNFQTLLGLHKEIYYIFKPVQFYIKRPYHFFDADSKLTQLNYYYH